MPHTVRIKKNAPRCLYFEVASASGNLIVRSTPYTSICKLETGLAGLTATAATPESVVVNSDGSTTWIGTTTRRSHVALEGLLSHGDVAELLAGLPSAIVVDARPSHERRADLTGPLCNLSD
jgi:hypothetical protein